MTVLRARINSQAVGGRKTTELMPIRTLFIGVLVFVCVAVRVTAGAQDSRSSNFACVAADEPIYQPELDGVKPPEIQKQKQSKGAPGGGGSFSIEILLNSQGRVCNVRLIEAKDRVAAAKAAEYIADHWKFRPATRQGKPVSVRFTMNFGPG